MPLNKEIWLKNLFLKKKKKKKKKKRLKLMFTIKHVYQSLKMKMQKGRCKHIDVKYINLFKKKMKENKIKLQ